MSATKSMRVQMAEMVQQTQKEICTALTQIDDGTFQEDSWSHRERGGGVSRVLQNGTVFEKAAVNISVIEGTMTEQLANATKLDLACLQAGTLTYFAAGISIVLHPHNPFVPTVHCNYRYFEVGDEHTPQTWWFGGGADLTPAYLFPEDATHFHQAHKATCEQFDPAFYPRFKQQCDEYFYISHRQEHRGIGGIFFEQLNDRSPAELFSFVSACAGTFIPAYLPIVQRRHVLPFQEQHKHWQQLRRGRYIEFNLVYDRGTAFGFRSNGRTESILVSLPLLARWEYNDQPAPDSPEAQLVAVLKHPCLWA